MPRRYQRRRVRLGRKGKARMRAALRRKAKQHTARTPLGHLFKRVAYQENYFTLQEGGAGVKTFGALQFSLDQLPNYTEFTNLYDLYKINKVRVEIIPKVTAATLDGAAQMPVVHSYIDSNDATAPTTIAQCMEQEDLKTTRGGLIHKRFFTPKCQQTLYESIATSGYATLRKNPFINTADPSVPHYSLKFCIENPITGGSAYWYADLKVTYYIGCREVQ